MADTLADVLGGSDEKAPAAAPTDDEDMGEDMQAAKETAASDLIDAQASGDTAAYAEAFQRMLEACREY